MYILYPEWEKASKLLCRNLRSHEVYDEKEYEIRKDWIAKEEDPCLICNNESCHNCGKPFHEPSRLTIEKGQN